MSEEKKRLKLKNAIADHRQRVKNLDDEIKIFNTARDTWRRNNNNDEMTNHVILATQLAKDRLKLEREFHTKLSKQYINYVDYFDDDELDDDEKRYMDNAGVIRSFKKENLIELMPSKSEKLLTNLLDGSKYFTKADEQILDLCKKKKQIYNPMIRSRNSRNGEREEHNVENVGLALTDSNLDELVKEYNTRLDVRLNGRKKRKSRSNRRSKRSKRKQRGR